MSEHTEQALGAAREIYRCTWPHWDDELAEIIDRKTKLPLLLATLETIAVLDPEEQDMWELQKWVCGVLAKVKGEE